MRVFWDYRFGRMEGIIRHWEIVSYVYTILTYIDIRREQWRR